MKKKIYIAGKVTGEDWEMCKLKFEVAAHNLFMTGFEPVNPLEVVGDPETSWPDAMKLCIKALIDCDAAFFLPCSEHSLGANLESSLAVKLGIPMFTEISELDKWKSSSQPTP